MQSYTNECLDTHLFLEQASASLTSTSTSHKNAHYLGLFGVCKLSVVVLLLFGTNIRLCGGAVSDSLAAGNEQVTLQATGRCSELLDELWQSGCGDVQNRTVFGCCK